MERKKTSRELDQLLQSIHRRSYPAYKDTKGTYAFGSYDLVIEHVQGDPFASPSRVNVKVSGGKAAFPREYYEMRHRRIALCDFLLRQVGQAVSKVNFKAKGSGKSGLMAVSRCGQEILERTACTIDPGSGDVTARFEIGFPANGRTIDAMELKKILFTYLPQVVDECLFARALPRERVQAAVWLADDQLSIREQLAKMGLCAFVADGAVLPRESGVSDKPMRQAVTFSSPESLSVSMELPHKGRITGMGIRRGITVVAGGGYHGKSTLLKALERGVYNHIAGDGREYVITDETAVKIRAEDGRSMKQADISMFMNHLPNKTDTRTFTTENASGSTSQAGNVVEAMEAGAGLMLIDEDTSATNFMIRDELMQKVIRREKEPIITFAERIGWLYEAWGISTVLVIGSSGVFFHVADTIIQMDTYRAYDITERAKEEASRYPATVPAPSPARPSFKRVFGPDPGLKSGERVKIKTTGLDSILINKELIDVRYMEQLVDHEQVVALGYVVRYLEAYILDRKLTLGEAVDRVWQIIGKDGLAAIADSSYISSDMAMPRRQEIFACMNRYRRL